VKPSVVEDMVVMLEDMVVMSMLEYCRLQVERDCATGGLGFMVA
jgi:hypothetical protein